MGTKLEYDWEESVGCWVALTSRSMNKAFNEELAPLGVTFPQAHALGWVAMEGPLSQAELAQRMGIEPPTLAGILERMERDGWIVREPCPGDRRRKLVRAGPAADPVWNRIALTARGLRERAVRGIPKKRLDDLRDVLERIRRNLHDEETER